MTVHTSRDATDCTDSVPMEAIMMKPARPRPPSRASPSIVLDDDDEDVAMQDAHIEFSDTDVDEEPIPLRTRSQSRIKETSMPPSEPVESKKKVKRGAKAVGAEKQQKPRRRRRIIEENTDEDS